MLPTLTRNRGNVPAQATHPIERLRREFDTMVEQLFGGLAPSSEQEESLRLWDIDVQEGEKETVVRAEIPGFEPDELNVEVEDNVLAIKAEKEQKTNGESRYSAYRRMVSLPSEVETDKVQATYHNGVLELHLPKSKETKRKRIEVKAS